MAMCSSGIPLKFIVFSLQLIENVLETSVEKQTDNYMRNKVPPRVKVGHTVFLKILLLIFVKKSRELRHTSFLDSKKCFFFNSTKLRYEQSLTLHFLA